MYFCEKLKYLLNLNYFNMKTDMYAYELPDFDGDCFEGFWMKFSIFVNRFNWSPNDMLFYLITSLRGKALEYVSYLPSETVHDVSLLYSALKRRFGDNESAQICRMKLRNICMHENESVQEYVCRVEINVRKAFPGVTFELLVKLVTEYVLYGYPDSDVSYRIFIAEPLSIDTLIKEILWQEHCKRTFAIQTSTTLFSDNYTQKDKHTSSSDARVIKDRQCNLKCSYCKLVGHIRRECPKR